MKKFIKDYISVFVLSFVFILIIGFFITIIFTKGDLNPPIIVDIGQEQTGVVENVVTLDDRTRDYYFYKGLNYTNSDNGLLPTGVNQNIYPDSKLVDATITYNSNDLNTNKKGYVSISERQDTYIYHKVYPLNDNGTSSLDDDYILIELIENPFTDRPTDKGFNGWYTSYDDVSLSYDSEYYIRYAKVPITYTNDSPNKITIAFNASWIYANVGYTSSGWNTAFNALNTKQMQIVQTHEVVHTPYDMAGYYKEITINRNASCNGYYDYYGNYQTNCRCNSWWGCTYYELIVSEPFSNSNNYYELVNGHMSMINNNTIPPGTYETVFRNDFKEGYNMASFYKQVNIPRYSDQTGYYDIYGNILSGNCNTGNGCNVYKLINYYDSNGNQELLNVDETYYYLATRDTNVIVLDTNLSSTWSSSNNKPFTFTGIYNGTNYNTTWTTNRAIVAYNDTNIENMTISSNASYTTAQATSSRSSSRVFYGNFQNIRIGRGISRYSNYSNFTTVMAGYNLGSGSSSNITKRRLIIESGYYSNLSLSNGSVGTSNTLYIEQKGIYGNDYDRATKNDDNLEIYFCASSAWGSYIRASSIEKNIFDLTVKSGNFGTSRSDYTTGIYVGGRQGGSHYAARMAKIEGGTIYNLIGGPLSNSSMANYNDSYIYVTGGNIDLIIGGAGVSATNGNRLIQVTGGKVNYSVFGGSNGYQGTSSDGTVIGSSFIYIGGTAEIGDQNLINNNSTIFGAEAGSVFGIGNGRNGYPSIGSSSNSNVIVSDHATINNNVYGGGNFGATGISSGENTTTTNIWMYGGLVKGSIYGGGNNNGSGNSSVKATVNISTYGGEVRGSLYGGSNALGTVYGDVNLNLVGGIFKDSVYGGGRGGYLNTSNIGTYVRDAINIEVGSSTSIPIITNNLYGGSAYGNVNTSVRVPTISSNGVNININNIQIQGSIYGGGKGDSTYYPYVAGNILVNVNDGNIPNLFGGNDSNGRILGSATLNLNGGTVVNSYGGGNQVAANDTYINLNGSTCTNIYGGSNQSGDVNSSNITTTSGTANTIFGGNNIGGVTSEANIIVNGGSITTLYGGGKLADTGKTNIALNSSTLLNVYGGGESANITTDTNLTLNGSTVTNLYGGSNQSGNVPLSKITVSSGSATNLYGGNNQGGSTLVTEITTSGGNVSTLYGGGKLADTNETNITINPNSNIGYAYGGGENASVSIDTNINLNGGTITTIYGGSNFSGTVTKSNIITTDGVVTTILGGNNQGGTTIDTNILVNGASIGTIYGGGNHADSTNSLVTINNTSSKINFIYGGGDAASVNGSNININGGTVGNTFGGSNQSGTVTTSNIKVLNNPTIDDIFGGNNMGGNTINSNLSITGGTIKNIYGGGNQADISSNTNITVNGSNVLEEVYGGGKDGLVSGNTSVRVTNTTIGDSLYAGGKGTTAVVLGNTILNVEGTTNVTNHVFGGGNAAATGDLETNNSTSTLNIAGGTIGKNVYGGANTSVVYGIVGVNIGYGVTTVPLIEGNISIGGTVFGGGEANASGDDNYDYSFISVTKGITINIKENTIHNIDIDGSIFGSGNASSTTGYSYINIDNYGTKTNHKRNISIQRADRVILNNSVVELFGATDRTNEYSHVLFTLSRIKELKLKNNSIIYLETGTNLLEKFTSVADISGTETKATVNIEDGVITKNVDNRIYALENKNINIAQNEAVTAYGEVNGMSFFGMYMRDRDGNIDEAFYSPNYNQGDTVKPGEFYMFSAGSYVLGMHKVNHNIEIDGFYSNYEKEESPGIIDMKYIVPTPENSNFYMWVIGEQISSYEVDLTASKFSTLGTYELSLINFPNPNTTFSIMGANYNGLQTGVELVQKEEIPRISLDGTADTKMSLVMRSSNTGWITIGETNFITDENNPIYGTKDYLSENSSVVPTLLFNVYHSKNLSNAGAVGTVTISLLAITPIDDLTNDVQRLNINVNITRALYTNNEYEGSMTPGEKHDFFVSTLTTITNKSKLSAYYSLYVEKDETIYKPGYHRTLVSSYALPENTKFTMIDLTTPTPTYYYYVVSAQDVIDATNEMILHNEASYKLSKFIKMGSTSQNNNYDDVIQNNMYYNVTEGIASEEYIFIVDFEDSGFTTDKLNNILLIELRDSGNQTITSVLGINHANLTYNLYNNKNAVIDLTATLSKPNIYIGESTMINANTNFIQQVVSGQVISDTTYYNKKLGLKISIYDSNDNLLNASSLLGVNYTYNGITYYPRMDGIVRINVSPRIANVNSKITINTKNSNLPSGTYKVKLESFGSGDGIYYGLVSSDTVDLSLNILNNIYGLVSKLSDESITIDSVTGEGTNKNNALVFNIEYSSGLANPNLRLSLKRRKYNDIYSLDYETVDISDYVTHSFNAIGDPLNKEYLITNSPIPNQILFLYMKTNLITGTYKVTFSLYDGNAYIGEVYNYIVIR